MTGERFGRIPLRAVGCRDLSACDWRVLACISLHADKAGRADPSMATIATMTGIRRSDIPRSVRRLERFGVMRTESGAGRSAVNVYTLIFDSGEMSASTTTGVSNVADRVFAPPLTGCPQIRCGDVRPDADLTDQEQTNEHTRARRAWRERDHDQEGASKFGAFWEAYPSRHPHPHPEEPARKKFAALVKGGIDPGVIIRGAANYATYAEQHIADPRYIKQPATWLNQRVWEQYQLPPEPPRLRVGMI
jgi:hypothetical protein